MKHLLSVGLLLLTFVGMAYGQKRTITGRVTSAESGEPLSGVSVMITGTSLGTATKADGSYSLAFDKANAVIRFSFIGMESQEVSATAASVYNIILKAKGGSLGEVVVTALGVKREKKALGYAVQELKGGELNKTKDLNIVNSLSGKVAGIQVTNAGGGVGSSSRIIIRGNNSFGNNQPLFVVDGVPVMNDATSVSAGQGVDYGNGAADIDPNNVESVSVLKGANAAALYGSRAANGVILITTKKGLQKGKLGVDFSSSLTFDNVYIMPKYQNEYGQGLYGSEQIWQRDHPEMSYQDYAKKYAYNYVDGRGSGVNDMLDESWGPRMDAGLKLDQYMGKDQPWISHPNNVKDFWQTGITSDNNIAVSSSGNKAAGRLSLSNLQVKGTIPNTDLSQNTVNFSGTLTPSDRLTAQVNVTYLQRKSDNLPSGQYTSSNPIFSIGGWTGRQVDMRLLKDNWRNNDALGQPYNWSQVADNPYLMIHNTNAMDRVRMFGNFNLSYKIVDWLTAKAVVGTDNYSEQRKNIIQSRSKQSSSGGRFEQTNIRTNETNADFLFLADKQISTAFRIDGTLGTNYRNNKYNSMWLQASQLTVPDLYTIGNVKGTVGSSMFRSEKETQSIYGSANISYNDYLFLGITGRNDWSSALPASNRSYFYPSFNLGFVFTDGFQMHSSVLTYGKVRGSWAQVGNDTGPYSTTATYAAGGTPWNGVALYNYARQIPPLGLKPEITSSFEVGTELRFFGDRIGLDLSYYNMKTNNQIMSVGISKPTGFSSILINAGEIQNTGVELMLTGAVLKNTNGLNWDIAINWAKNKNKVNRLYPGIESYDLGPANNVIVQAIPGEPFGQIKGGAYKRDGSGNIIVDSKGVPMVVSGQTLGNVLPDWTGGINNSFTYRNFNLSFLLDMRWGGDLFSYTIWHNQANGTLPNTTANNVRETGLIVDGVKEDGTKNDIRITAEDYFRGNYIWDLHENAIVNASYIKLRELTLNYRIPVQKIKFLSSASIGFVGRNLALLYTHKSNIAHIDPETGMGTGNNGLGIEIYQLPPSRSLGLKLQLGF